MINEKHLAATLKNRLPGWQCDVQEFIKELIADRNELKEKLGFAIKVGAEKATKKPEPVVLDPKEDEQVVEKLVVEKKPKKPVRKSLFGGRKSL